MTKYDEMTVAPALFLDLDGTVRHSKRGQDTFISGASDVIIYDDVISKLVKYHDDGWVIFGVTNQGGVAFGHKSEDDVEDEHRAMLAQLGGAGMFSAIYSCVFHPMGARNLRRKSLLRKPYYGMLVRAEIDAMELGGVLIDWHRSIMVGDRDDDRLCALNAGITFAHACEFFGRDCTHQVPLF